MVGTQRIELCTTPLSGVYPHQRDRYRGAGCCPPARSHHSEQVALPSSSADGRWHRRLGEPWALRLPQSSGMMSAGPLWMASSADSIAVSIVSRKGIEPPMTVRPTRLQRAEHTTCSTYSWCRRRDSNPPCSRPLVYSQLHYQMCVCGKKRGRSLAPVHTPAAAYPHRTPGENRTLFVWLRTRSRNQWTTGACGGSWRSPRCRSCLSSLVQLDMVCWPDPSPTIKDGCQSLSGTSHFSQPKLLGRGAEN
jgi:hypothetical protein